MDAAIIQKLRDIVGREHILTQGNALQRGSLDFYWFSPVLKAQLAEKQADVIVQPGTIDELLAAIAQPVRERIPITPRGAGTGNYGQSIPLQGGIVLNMRRLDQIVELTPIYACVQAGLILHRLEQAAREVGAEMRFYPSTLPTATAGGFLAGGSGGVGSVSWGTLWDEGNVLSATVATIEEEPRLLVVDDPAALQGVIHSCGLTGIIVDLTFALAPAEPWQQYAVAFDTFETALHCAEKLARDETLAKRLVSVIEWPTPSYFGPLVKQGACPEGRALLLLHLVAEPEHVRTAIEPFQGQITWHDPDGIYRPGKLMLTDFAWNHTTLWAIKADERFTYLQDQFDPARVYDQLAERKARYSDEIVEHIEFMKFGGRLVPQGMTLVRYQSPEQLRELTEFCESIGIWTADPHTHILNEDARWNGSPILDAKAIWDPHKLLNPGHLRRLQNAETDR